MGVRQVQAQANRNQNAFCIPAALDARDPPQEVQARPDITAQNQRNYLIPGNKLENRLVLPGRRRRKRLLQSNKRYLSRRLA